MTSCLNYYSSFLSGLMAFTLAISNIVWHTMTWELIFKYKLGKNTFLLRFLQWPVIYLE